MLLWQGYPETAYTCISVHFTGAENKHVFLNAITGAACMLTDDGKEKIAGSFAEWFANEILRDKHRISDSPLPAKDTFED